MFLDEKLEKIYSEHSANKAECAKKLIISCIESLDTTNNKTYLNSLKRVDYSWKLFCKKHKEYDSNGFRNYIFKCATDKADIIKKALNW